MSDQNTIVQEFLIESFENLEELDQELVRLEKHPDSKESLASVFRTIHTIKGTSSFLGFSKLEALTHKGEGLLSRLRDGKLLLNGERTDALLEMVDAIREMLALVESTQGDGENCYQGLIEDLVRLQSEDEAGASSEQAQPAQSTPPGASEFVVSETESDRHVSEFPQHAEAQSQELEFNNVVEMDVVESSAANSSLRINVELLDKIMDLVGELVLARNQIIAQDETERNADLTAKYQRLNHITSELQESVIKTRMQPISRIWNTVPRQVREVANECGKQARVDLLGKDTELDKSIIEAIKGPITHLVRNCVDHGLETPEERQAANKSMEGCIRLNARHESGQVVIEVSDDGRGLDVAKIRARALERELITAEHAEQWSERQWFEMIFEPGFSTAAKVTNISGRGVGLDVVKTNIERLAGAIELTSVAGQGTSFQIKIPLTLAIIPALIVSEGECRYAIPQSNLTELVRMQEEDISQGIETIYDAQVFRLRGELLPLLNLHDVLAANHESKAEQDLPSTEKNIVVVDTGQRRFGLVVDSIRDTQEIVIKPLGRALRGLPIYSGATILGDGQVALIMDVAGIAQLAGLGASQGNGALRSEVSENEFAANTATEESNSSANANWLVVTGRAQRQVIEMRHVQRLEQFDSQMIECSNGAPVIQYRGDILPLLNGQGLTADSNESRPIQVVVVAHNNRSAGYVVDQIDDIVSAPHPHPEATINSIVVGGSVSDIVNVPQLLA